MRRIQRRDSTAATAGVSISTLEQVAQELGVVIGNLCPDDRRLEVLQLIYTWRDLNGSDLSKLPQTDLIQHRVRIKPGTKPFAIKHARRNTPLKEYWLRKLVLQGIEGGIFEQTLVANGRLSEWSAAPLLVNKIPDPSPEDEPRLVIDYSNVEEVMPGTHLQLTPRVHDYLSDPRHATFFVADLKHAYYSVGLHPEDRHYFAFYLPDVGQLQPTRMMQGSQSSAFTMNELMNLVFGPIPAPQSEPSLLHYSATPLEKHQTAGLAPLAYYMDDIFGGAQSFDEQLEFLGNHLFPRLDWAGLKLSFKKLKLFVDQIKALGIEHHIGGRLSVLPHRAAKILEWPEPQNAKQVREFLGAVGIIRRWVKNFTETARPLQRLTSIKIPWRFEGAERLAFNLLRIRCARAVAIKGVDWSLPVHMYTDASGYAGGMVITQHQKNDSGTIEEVPLFYDSVSFSHAQQKYGTYKRELFTIVHFVKKYAHLMDHPDEPAVIHSDHKPLVHFLKATTYEGIYERWALAIKSHNIKIVYITGPRNAAADGISRTIFASSDCTMDEFSTALNAKVEESIATGHTDWIWSDSKTHGFEAWLDRLSAQQRHLVTTTTLTVNEARWAEDYEKSEWFGEIWRHLTGENVLGKTAAWYSKTLDYCIQQGHLWKLGPNGLMMCIPETRVAALLRHAHDDSGHWGKESTLIKMRGACYWPKMSDDVERYLAGCWECIKHSPARHSQLLQPVLAMAPFQIFGMDFIGPLPLTLSGNKFIFHVVCYFSKYTWTWSSPTCLWQDVINALEELFNKFMAPRVIYADQGQHFITPQLRKFLMDHYVSIEFSPSGASKSTGMIEVSNRILESVLRKNHQLDEWDTRLAQATLQLNARLVKHIKYTPHQVMFGLAKPSLQPLEQSVTTVEVRRWIDDLSSEEYHSQQVDVFMQYRAQVREQTGGYILAEKQQLKERYDRSVKEYIFKLGAWVFLFQKDTGKLSPRWRGPFLIAGFGRHGVSYKLEQINGLKIRGLFHGDHLREYRPREGYLALEDQDQFVAPTTTLRPIRRRKAKAGPGMQPPLQTQPV